MFATTTIRFALVAAVLSSLTGAAPLRKDIVRRAENDGQLAQGTNFYFSSLHLEDVCSPGQVACVSGNYATCSGEGNWEITPCTSGTTCLATPASSPSGISVQCTSKDTAQSSIQNAGGDPNTIAADFHVTDAPFHVETVANPSNSSSSAAPTSTASEPSSASADSSAATNAPTETASSTESASSSTCTPDDGDDDGTIADGPTDTASQPTPTETQTPSPTGTCTDEPVETETITVIVVPVPSQSGVYSTTTLFPEEPEATVTGTDVPVPTGSSSDSSSDLPSSTESSTESAPTQDPSYTEPAPTESSSEASVPTESSSQAASTESPSSSSSSSEPVATVTTIFVDPGFSIPPLPTGAGDATASIAIPVVSVVGTHTVPVKRMVRVIRRA